MPNWLRSYGLLLRWNILRLRTELPLFLIIQTLLSVGVVLGFSFLMPSYDRETALYLTTGAPTVALVTVGMVLAPQMVAQQKLRGMFDYQRAMPVPRMAMLAADATVWMVVAIPGMIAALLVGVARFDLTLSVSPLVLPAALLVALVAVSVGYAVAYLVKPEVVGVITNLILIMTMMFSPVNYPAERLPDWLAAAHQFLPFQYLAQALRDTLDTPAGGLSAVPFLVLAGWAVVGLGVTYRVMTRRA
ncbi:ABC transporter permease [Natronosporangium hydrolyticum]|uniref:ABC transporter permease n=1 Tax=Natronosporangium hydrolyticum TaxID=2811111 RepID=A0A895YDM5_9ACTN|nr:ABC transporter permease [Natronosporangium hydrolyticum]QSB15661.1 ABC transporter permease [Natronosporangium hydrolyticum]